MARKGITLWNAAVTSGGIGIRRHVVYVIVAMVLVLFTEILVVNVAGRGSSRERLGTSNIFLIAKGVNMWVIFDGDSGCGCAGIIFIVIIIGLINGC